MGTAAPRPRGNSHVGSRAASNGSDGGAVAGGPCSRLQRPLPRTPEDSPVRRTPCSLTRQSRRRCPCPPRAPPGCGPRGFPGSGPAPASLPQTQAAAACQPGVRGLSPGNPTGACRLGRALGTQACAQHPALPASPCEATTQLPSPGPHSRLDTRAAQHRCVSLEVGPHA